MEFDDNLLSLEFRSMPENSRTKPKKVRDGNVEIRAKGVAGFCSSGFYSFRILNAFWLSTGGGPRQLFCKKFFAMLSYYRSEFRVLIYMAYCGRKEHQRKVDGYIS